MSYFLDRALIGMRSLYSISYKFISHFYYKNGIFYFWVGEGCVVSNADDLSGICASFNKKFLDWILAFSVFVRGPGLS